MDEASILVQGGVIMSLWDWLFDPSGLTAHGFCLSWAPGLIALHAGSDAAIGLSYLSIPIALAWLIHRRRDVQYGWMIYSFVAFILACGTTHLLSILTLWVPAYGVEGLVKLVTAALSIATAALLWPLIPRLVALPSPAQLGRLNAELSNTIAEYERTTVLLRESEARGRAANIELERRVVERTADLREANDRLTEALAARAAVQQALGHSEAEFRASFEGAAVGKALVEPVTRRILRANRAFAGMLGYEPAELIGHTAEEFTWPEDRASDAAEYARLVSGETETHVREKRYKRRNGAPFWVRVSATLARVPESSHPILTVAAIEDIDAWYTAEAELRAAKRDLEIVVDERTAALAQRDLLLREVYHRVKNNLQIVDSLLMMQARQLEDPLAKRALLGMRGRIYALGLVHHQLMGSADLKTFDVAPFLNELSTNLLEGSANGSVNLSVEAFPLDVGLDFAVPLGLVVTELVTNSLKHAFPEGTGNISVVLRPGTDGQMVLTVSDDGRGQLSGAPSDRPKTGLGIGIVKSLVAQLEGTMIVRNDNGMTTEIRTAMPVHQ
ncbi:MAG TPA: histidine kinase dimerization/phosphoacceptor domain -containing protein [Stellaceae bacterium]|nr:histidine kinase dimerization/phosphoacceptor domain -containing protein [Stellaceae bacterium]